ncbi:MAG: beta strand repeat-containing protein, partial [Desulfitobacteriaceae bacterium]
MKKRMNISKLGLVFGLSLIAFVLFGTLLPRTALGDQSSLNINPEVATISLGSTQQFEALFTNSPTNAFNYALFSGSSTSGLLLNGANQTINGSSHSNKDFLANGSKLTVTGTCEAVTTVRTNGSQIHIGTIVQNAPYVEMPDFSDQIKTQADAAGQTYNGNKTYNGSNINVQSPIYVNGNLTINGSHFSGKGTIVATGNITFNGSNLNNTGDDSVCFYSKNGNILINGANAILNGMVYAPNGTITMNGANQTIYGRVVGNQVTMNGSGLNIISGDNDLESLPQITWSSSNLSVASVSSTGLATGTGVGTCTITATYKINNITYTDTAQLTVVLPTLTISPDPATILLGYTKQYQATLSDIAGNQTDVTQSVIWSSNKKLSLPYVTFSSTGLATGNIAGIGIITATYIFNGVNITDTATLNIVNFSLTPASKIISLGSTQQYQAIITDSDGNVTDVTQSVNGWSCTSLGLTLATINSSGLATATGLGTCTIQATYLINGVNITTSTPLTIVLPTLSITPIAATISLGSTQQYAVTLTDADGNTTDVTSSVTWSSGSTGVATINTSGLVSSVGVGTSTITGTYTINGVSLTAATPLTIVLPIMSLTPTNTTILSGSTTQYQATLTDAAGHTTDVMPSVAWTSDKTNVATIAPTTGLA